MRVTDGTLTVNEDRTVSQEAALISGTTSVLGQTTTANTNIVLNGNLTAGQSLVVLTGNGTIQQQSGTLTAPAIGLGAPGGIGTVATPIQIQANDLLARNPELGNVADTNGFVVTPSVSAAGATVNQANTPPPPITPPPTTPPPTTPATPAVPATVAVAVALTPALSADAPTVIPEAGVAIEPTSFAQNNDALVEEVIDILKDFNPETFPDIDHTLPPVQVTDDEFLRKKFRR